MTTSRPFPKAARGLVAAVSLFLLSIGGPVRDASALLAPAPDARFQGLRQAMKRVSTQYQPPSLSVAVVQGGKIVFEESIGWASLEPRVAATPETMYSLAAVTQVYTATGVMLMVERGKLSLDQAANTQLRVDARLKVHEGTAADVTVRRLLTHSGGVPPFYQYFYRDTPELPAAISTTIQRYGMVAYPPGETSIYSDLDYALLGTILFRVGQKELGDLIVGEMGEKLDMKHTVLGMRGAAKAAIGYGDNLKPLPQYLTAHDSSTGLFSSVHDLARFAMAHLTGPTAAPPRILKDESIQAMQKGVVPAESEGPGISRGLGWTVKEDDYGYRRVASFGAMPGATALLVLIPQEGVAVAVLINRSLPAAATDIADQALAAVLPKFAAALAAKPRPAPVEEKPAAFSPAPPLQGSWDGIVQAWSGEVPFKVRVEPAGTVHVKLGAGAETALTDLRAQGNGFTGRFDGPIPTKDAQAHKHTVQLRLALRGTRLAGWASAIQYDGRPYGSLPSWVELWRPGARPSPSPSPKRTPTPKGIPEGPPMPTSPVPTPPPSN